MRVAVAVLLVGGIDGVGQLHSPLILLMDVVGSLDRGVEAAGACSVQASV